MNDEDLLTNQITIMIITALFDLLVNLFTLKINTLFLQFQDFSQKIEVFIICLFIDFLFNLPFLTVVKALYERIKFAILNKQVNPFFFSSSLFLSHHKKHNRPSELLSFSLSAQLVIFLLPLLAM